MLVGDRVEILEQSKYRGRLGKIRSYSPVSDSFDVLVEDSRPFNVSIYAEHLKLAEKIETFTAEEFDSIFD